MKNHVRKSHMIARAIILVFILLVIAAVLTQTSFAKQIGQVLGLDPDEGLQPAGQTVDRLQGIQPDENGYTGRLPAGAESVAGPGESPDGLSNAWQSAVTNAPDVDGYQGENPAAAVLAPTTSDNPDGATSQPEPVFGIEANARDSAGEAMKGWTGFYYVFAAGSSLHSADYTMRQDYQPGSCASVLDSGIQFLTLNLDLPDGARIDYLRLFYYDTNASDGIANIRKYDGAGANTEITTVSSTGTAGYGTTLSAYSGTIVDNTNGGYVLNWEPMEIGSTMQLCGLRVAYRLPN